MLTAPGMSTGQVGDDIAVATDNCNNINRQLVPSSFACNYDGNYDGKPGDPNGWLQQGGDSRYPRVVNLFIVPYQSTKGLTGAGDAIPILGFASFYVMNWTGANNNQSDPCPDTTWDNDGNPAHPAGQRPGSAQGRDHGRLRRDRGLRARPRRPERDLRRGPADAVQGHARPMICRYSR